MATIYVRSGAAGNGSGSDWTNARTTVPSTPARGDVIYVADGTGYTLDWEHIADSGTTRIRILKATIADHGTSVGWDNAYGDGQAIFSAVLIAINYVDFDGQVGGGGTNGITSYKSGHGFRVSNTADTVLFMLSSKFGAPGDRVNVNDIYIGHTEMDSLITPGNCEGINLTANGAVFSNITVDYCYLHDIGDGPITFMHSSDCVVQNSYIGRNGTNPLHHGVLIRHDFSDRIIYRYNWFENGIGTGFVGAYDGTGDAIEFYGNVFCYAPAGIDSAAYADTGGGAGAPDYGNGVIYTLNNDTVGIDARNWKFYNNTFVNLPDGNSIRLFISASGNNVSRNNLFYSAATGSWSFINVTDSDYNGFGSPTTISGVSDAHKITINSNPFVDMANQDFRLASNLVGVDLASPYNADGTGAARTSGQWSIGAFQFGGGGGATTAKRSFSGKFSFSGGISLP